MLQSAYNFHYELAEPTNFTAILLVRYLKKMICFSIYTRILTLPTRLSFPRIMYRSGLQK